MIRVHGPEDIHRVGSPSKAGCAMGAGNPPSVGFVDAENKRFGSLWTWRPSRSS